MIPIVKRLASFLQRQTGCKVTVCDALENKGVKGKSVQTKGAAQRSQRLKGHVSVRSSVSLQNTMVILVDDIVTTGATMRSCVETMRKNGATLLLCSRWRTLRRESRWTSQCKHSNNRRKIFICHPKYDISAG